MNYEQWFIPHPGTLKRTACASFTEAIDKLFEGFNIPVLVIDGVQEPFHVSVKRVENFYKIKR